MFSKNVSLHFSTSLFLLFVIGFLASTIIQLLSAAPAKADCTYGGKKYSTGDTRGPYICMPDGSWQRK